MSTDVDVSLTSGDMETPATQLPSRAENIENSRGHPPPPKKVKISTRGEERMKLLQRIAERNPSPQFDEIDHAFLTLAKIVKTLPRHEQIKLRTQFFTMAGEAELQYINTPPQVQSPSLESRSSEDLLTPLLSP